jgi:hypothetical protein
MNYMNLAIIPTHPVGPQSLWAYIPVDGPSPDFISREDFPMLLLTESNLGVGGVLATAASDNDLRFTSGDLTEYSNIQVQTDNAADVEISMDRGASWVSTAVALEDPHVAAGVGTRVLVTAANKVFRVAPGLRFTNLRIRQAGATAVSAFKILCSSKDD